MRREADGTITVGITDYGQLELNDIVFVYPASAGRTLRSGEKMAEIESTKVMWELAAPVAGEVLEVNAALDQKPELLNQDPYASGWIAKMRPSEPSQLDGLLDAAGYRAVIGA